MLHTEASAAEPARCIAEGDLVVVYEGFDSMKAVRVTEKGQYNNKYGNFDHKDWLGKPFGIKVHARKGSGWMLLLAPTPELWTNVLRHRTQILYAADIAMVCSMLELRPGSTVLESGTGSGSLTHSLARAVAPTGHVWTFEFHEQRATMAAAEFEANGLSECVTVTQRDIEDNGFPAELEGKADGVFLDLPKPYKVVPSASRCIRPDGMFCSFSPCIEQVQRTCEALNANGFRDIRTMEVLLRQHEVSRQALLTDLDAPAPAPQKKQQQQQRKRQQQDGGGGGQGGKRQKTEGSAAAAAAAAGGQGEEDSAVAAAAAGSAAPESSTAKGGSEAAAPVASAEANGPEEAGQQQGSAAGTGRQQQPATAAAAAAAAGPAPPQRQVVSKPVPFGRGHTGYLTFARRVVSAA